MGYLVFYIPFSVLLISTTALSLNLTHIDSTAFKSEAEIEYENMRLIQIWIQDTLFPQGCSDIMTSFRIHTHM